MEEVTTIVEDEAKEILNHIAMRGGSVPKEDIFPVEKVKDLCIILHDYKSISDLENEAFIVSPEEEAKYSTKLRYEYNKMFPEFISTLQNIWNGGFLLSISDKKQIMNSLRETLILVEQLVRNKKEIYQIIYPGEKVPKIFH